MVTTGLSTQGSLYISETSGDPCITFAIPLRTDKAKFGEISRKDIPATDVPLSDIVASLYLAMGPDTNAIPPAASEAALGKNTVNDGKGIAEESSASMEETTATTQQIHAAIELIINNSKVIVEQVEQGAKLSENIINRAHDLRDASMSAT